MPTEVTIALNLEECCAIAARAEIEKLDEKPDVWCALWDRIRETIKAGK